LSVRQIHITAPGANDRVRDGLESGGFKAVTVDVREG
jgi:hypothetical protein